MMFRFVRHGVCANRMVHGSFGKYSTGNAFAVSQKPYTRVEDYYAGKSILITGGTGFVGKVFIERLLYNCKDIERIFVLIRPKKGVDVQRRLQSIFEIPLFDKLKQTRPDALRKVTAIEGDITTTNLGIKEKDEQKLVDQVSLVFHSAATVRFADTFDSIMNINLEGTRNVMDLSKNIKNLESFVYISTAYSNAHKLVIDEKLYTPPKDLEEVRKFVREHGKNEEKVKKFLKNIPNTYALSKALSENLVNVYKGDMPSIIVRPSVVCPIINEPLQGWMSTWVGPTVLFCGVSKGILPIIYGRQDVVCDLIPVDHVTNLTILAAAKGNKTKDVLVYNICSSAQNPITWKQASDLFLEESRKHGYSNRKERPLQITMSPAKVKGVTFLNKARLFFADVGLVLRGQKPRYLREHKRAMFLRDITIPFTTTNWLIKCNRTLSLIDSLDEYDKGKFPCNPNDIKWNEYMPIFCRGVKRYLLEGK